MATLFVGNQSFILTDAELEYWFEATGYPVESAHVTSDRNTNSATGTIFVVLRDQLRDAMKLE